MPRFMFGYIITCQDHKSVQNSSSWRDVHTYNVLLPVGQLSGRVW